MFDPLMSTQAAAAHFISARNASADPVLIQLGDGLTQLAYAANGIAQRQKQIETLIAELLRQQRS